MIYAASREKSFCLSGDYEMSFVRDSHPEQLRYPATQHENKTLKGNDDGGMLGDDSSRRRTRDVRSANR